MKKINVLVTGGAGFIGSHLCEKLLEKNYRVTVIDNLSVGKKKNISKKIKFIKKDILNYKSCDLVCKNIDIVVHLAAKVSIRNSVNTLDEDIKNNINGTINILNASAKNKVKKFIFASSMAVYKKKNRKPFFETDETEPLSPYGVSKLAAEKYIMLMAPKMNIKPVILRLFNTFGARQTMTPYVGVITIFVNNILNGKTCRIYGNGKQKRDFIYVGDIVNAFLLTIKSNKSVGQIFNVGSGKVYSVNKVFNTIKKLMKIGKSIHVKSDSTELNYVSANIDKAKKVLGFKPMYSFEKKIKEVITYISTR
jgi:nucleoside-diphosphate-sugar epimerase